MTPFRATYRLQLGPGLGFAEARALVPYLAGLGVSHLYLSPSLQARTGSTHGYDVVDPTSISRELGGEDEFRALAGAARAAGLGILLDIVPNHMATGDENRWWADPVLRQKFFDVDPETGFYRRFFDIDDLAGIRVEDPEVFDVTHGKVLALLEEGLIDGVRVDHPDGLADPAGYLERLRSRGAEHVWAEKILGEHETLRDWPVEGTVGYEFCADVAALFMDPSGESALTSLWVELCADSRPFEDWALEAQLEQARTTFSREVDRLRKVADLPGLEEALAGLPVYRTYVEPGSGLVTEEDRMEVAASGASAALARALVLDDRSVPAEFVVRFQQTSPPVTAKGVEDTAFYRYVRLLALNEVGGEPGRFGLSVDGFHAGCLERAARFPRNLLVGSTHDTKRSADVRARIGVLAGMAEEWSSLVQSWRSVNASLRGSRGPSGAEELLIYQTLVGAWPISGERLDQYLEKALREAKQATSWVAQDAEYEAEVQGFARALLDHEPFLETFLPFAERVAAAGEVAALGQLVLRLTSPGVPDVYGGDELEFLFLVDPDNRRPVDWEARRQALAEVHALGEGEAPRPEHGKLFAIVRLLALHDGLPLHAYEPIDAGEDVVRFRRGDVEVAVAVRPGAALPSAPGPDVLGGHVPGCWVVASA